MKIEIFDDINKIPNDVMNKVIKFDSECIIKYFYDPFTFNIGIIKSKNGEVLGAGLIRIVNEFKMILNSEKSNIIKAKTLKFFMDNALILSQCNEIFLTLTFPNSNNNQDLENYKKLLKNHYNFYDDYSNSTLKLEK